MRIVLFGTPTFALPVAEALRQIGELLAVVTQPDRPKGRKQVITPPPLKAWAQSYNSGSPVVGGAEQTGQAAAIEILQPQKLDKAFADKLKSLKPDVGVIASYGNIIPKDVLNVVPKGIVNVHPSILPRHRGAAPIQETILSGDVSAGVTLMLTDEKMDHGPIIAQEHLPVWPHESAQELEERLSHHAADMLKRILPKWTADEIEPTPQEHEDATYTRMFTREDGKISWDEPAGAIERQIRAFDPWPGTYTTLPDDTRLKILNIAVLPGEAAAPGTLREGENGEMEVRAQDAWIRLLNVQPAGKNEMEGSAYLHGHRDLIGSILP